MLSRCGCARMCGNLPPTALSIGCCSPAASRVRNHTSQEQAAESLTGCLNVTGTAFVHEAVKKVHFGVPGLGTTEYSATIDKALEFDDMHRHRTSPNIRLLDRCIIESGHALRVCRSGVRIASILIPWCTPGSKHRRLRDSDRSMNILNRPTEQEGGPSSSLGCAFVQLVGLRLQSRTSHL